MEPRICISYKLPSASNALNIMISKQNAYIKIPWETLKMHILWAYLGASRSNPLVVGLEVFVFKSFSGFSDFLLNLRIML